MGRQNNFDALRLTGALLVLFSHMYAVAGWSQPNFISDLSIGTLGVLIFFSISGYLVTASWNADPDLGRFLARRFLRIAPGVVVAMVTAYLVVGSLGLMGFPESPLHWLNGSLWTIPMEVECYFLLALAALVLPRPGVVIGVGMLLAYWLLPQDHLTFYGLFFGAGATLRQVRASDRAMWLAIAAGIALVLLNYTIVGLALIIPPVALMVGERSWPVLREAGRFGDLSYGVYIYAWPVQQLVYHYMPGSYVSMVTVTLVITTGLAWLSWRYIEKPMLARKPLARPLEPPKGEAQQENQHTRGQPVEGGLLRPVK